MPNFTMNDSNAHYVKFMRGSTAAWEALKATPNKISNDTLYFIYEDANTSTNGKLYLGLKLISGSDENQSGDINLSDIGDINIDDSTLAHKQILVFNSVTQEWQNADLADIIDTAIGIMEGATSAAAGVAGLVPVPAAGDEVKFLRGDGTWATVNIPTFNADIFSRDAHNDIILNGYNLAPVGSVPIKTSNGIDWVTPPTGTLDRQITTLEKLRAQIAGTDPDPISETTIYMVDNGSGAGSSDRYDEYMIINGSLERLGTFGQVDLTNYITVTTFNQTIGSLEDLLYDTTDQETGIITSGLISRVNAIELTTSQVGNLNDLLFHPGNSTIVQEINSINGDISDLADKLKWQDIEIENS